MSERVPTSQEFEACCREAFSLLLSRGFTLEPETEFSRRLRGRLFDVIVQGEGYGTIASVSLSDPRGRVPLSLLVPRSERRRPPSGQLAQIRFFAHQVLAHCTDLIEGRTERLYQAHAEWERISRAPARKR